MQTAKDNAATPQRYDYRLVFSKTGAARFISHLDMMRTMQRVFRRAKLPIWYTQGFNPRPYMMFPLALPLGTESDVEILDISLVEDIGFDELLDRANLCVPDGLRFVRAYAPAMKPAEIALAEYEIAISADKPPQYLKDSFLEFLSLDKIEIEKRVKSKRKGGRAGFKTVDIKPHLEASGAVCEARSDRLEITLTLPCGMSFNLNTSVVIDAFCEKYGIAIEEIYTKRTKIMCENGDFFT